MSQNKEQKIFLVINKHAGLKKGEDVEERILSYLEGRCRSVDYAFTCRRGHATELAEKASADGYDLVVAVGGDGTVNEVAQGLVGKNTVMGIIPIGSGNGLARELKIPMQMRRSAKKLIKGKNLKIDICRVNQQPFLCTSGVGFDAQIAYLMSKASSRGFVKYIKLVIGESLAYKPLMVRMKIDRKIIEEPVFLITFANASQFGNNAFIAPGASMTDGLIDVVVVYPFSKFWLPVFAFALFTGLVSRLPFVHCYRAENIMLETIDAPFYHFDGEPGQLNLPAQIKTDSGKIIVRC